jgi:hypothetical protein
LREHAPIRIGVAEPRPRAPILAVRHAPFGREGAIGEERGALGDRASRSASASWRRADLGSRCARSARCVERPGMISGSPCWFSSVRQYFSSMAGQEPVGTPRAQRVRPRCARAIGALGPWSAPPSPRVARVISGLAPRRGALRWVTWSAAGRQPRRPNRLGQHSSIAGRVACQSPGNSNTPA